MGKFDAHKLPFQYRMGAWAQGRMNNAIEKMAKSMPCHVTEVQKDFIKVAFETANGIFSMPIVKIPQSWSQFSREPTQKGNKGYAVPGNYYLGGVTGDSGGNTDFYPRGNLTTLSFNGTSHTQNPGRNYDQLTHMAGPEGWISTAFQDQQQDQQSGGGSGGGGSGGSAAAAISPAVNAQALMAQAGRARTMSIQRAIAKNGSNGSNGTNIIAMSVNAPVTRASVQAASNGGNGGGGSSGSGGQQQQGQTQDSGTNFNFNKSGVCTIQSADKDHNITVDKPSGKITLNIPVGKWGYAGGDGQKGKYARIMTESGPSVNFKARIG